MGLGLRLVLNVWVLILALVLVLKHWVLNPSLPVSLKFKMADVRRLENH